MKDAVAIIVAGGQGKRFGGRVRKQYLSLSGQPLVWWSIRAFDRSPSIEAIVLVVPKDDLAPVRQQISRWSFHKPVHVIEGGKTRRDSVNQGLVGAPPGGRWIAVHDAVRPLVTPELIEKVLREARRHRAAIAACPSKDTIKIAHRGQMIQKTPPRATIWLAQTPQIFERSLLERAHLKDRQRTVTDDAQMVERLGVRVKLVESSSDNLKVTVPSDLAIARILLKKRK